MCSSDPVPADPHAGHVMPAMPPTSIEWSTRVETLECTTQLDAKIATLPWPFWKKTARDLERMASALESMAKNVGQMNKETRRVAQR